MSCYGVAENLDGKKNTNQKLPTICFVLKNQTILALHQFHHIKSELEMPQLKFAYMSE